MDLQEGILSGAVIFAAGQLILPRTHTTGPPPLAPQAASNFMCGLSISVALLGFVQFYNARENDLVFDDHLAIRNNAIVSGENSTWSDVWTHDFWGKPLKDPASHKSWRPVTTLSFRLNVLHNGGFDAASMHLTNNVLHALVSALLAWVAYDLFRCLSTSFYAAVLFAVHPVHVEAVTGIVARSECLCALFYLIGLLAYRRASVLLYIACAALALLSKETGLTVICMAIVHDFVVVGGFTEALEQREPLWTGLLLCGCSCEQVHKVHEDGDGELQRRRCLALGWPHVLFILRFCIHLGIAIAYIACRLVLMVDHSDAESGWKDMTLSSSGLIRRSENPFTFLNGTSKVLSYAYLQAKYAELLFLPREFCCEYSYDCIPAVRDLADPRNLASVALISLLAYCVVTLVMWPNEAIPCATRQDAGCADGGDGNDDADVDENAADCTDGDDSDADDQPGASLDAEGDAEAKAEAQATAASNFTAPRGGLSHPEAAARAICLAMAIVPFLPATGLLTRLGTLVAERLLYMPSMGVCLLVGRLIAVHEGQPLLVWPGEGPSMEEPEGCMPRAASPMARKTITLAVFGAITAYLASTTWVRTMDWRTDETLFASALKVCPRSAKVQRQVGQNMLNHATQLDPTAYSSAEERAKAEQEAQLHFELAREIDPEFCDLDFNFAMLAFLRKDYGTAGALFRRSLPCPYTNQRAFVNLQLLWNAWQEGGANISVHQDMAEVFEMMEKKEDAILHWRECAVLSLKRGKYKAAEKYFKEALRIDSHRCDVRYWRGKMYLEMAEGLGKKKRTRERRKKMAELSEEAVQQFEYCARKSCKELEMAHCVTELTKLYPQVLTSAKDRSKVVLAPDAKQARLSHGFSRVLSIVVNHPIGQHNEQTSSVYRLVSLFHSIRAGTMYALLGDIQEAINAFEDIVADDSDTPESGGVIRCLAYQWIAVAAQELYETAGEASHRGVAKRARKTVKRFPSQVRRLATPFSEGGQELTPQDQADLTQVIHGSLRNPHLAQIMQSGQQASDLVR